MKLRKHKQALAKCADDLASRRHDTFYREDCSDRHYFYSLQVLIGKALQLLGMAGNTEGNALTQSRTGRDIIRRAPFAQI